VSFVCSLLCYCSMHTSQIHVLICTPSPYLVIVTCSYVRVRYNLKKLVLVTNLHSKETTTLSLVRDSPDNNLGLFCVGSMLPLVQMQRANVGSESISIIVGISKSARCTRDSFDCDYMTSSLTWRIRSRTIHTARCCSV